MKLEKPIPSKSQRRNNVLGLEVFFAFVSGLMLPFVYSNVVSFFFLFFFFCINILLILFKLTLKNVKLPYSLEFKESNLIIKYATLKDIEVIEESVSNIKPYLNRIVNSSTNIEDVYLSIDIQNESFEFKRISGWKHSEQKMIFELICQKQFHQYTDDDLHWLMWMDKMIAIFES